MPLLKSCPPSTSRLHARGVAPPSPGADVEPVLLHTFDELTTGIAELEPDVFVVFTTNAYTTHENYMHRLDLRGWMPEREEESMSDMRRREFITLLGGAGLRTRPGHTLEPRLLFVVERVI